MSHRSQADRLPVLGRLAALALLVSLAGCGSTRSSRFYVLTPHPPTTAARAAANDQLALGIGPVALPLLLDRPQLVWRLSASERSLSEYSRWAEPLDANMARVLAENLAPRLGTERVFVDPFPASVPLDYRVSLDIVRCDAGPSGDLVLAVRWSLFDGTSREHLGTRLTTLSEPLSGSQDPGALVAAMSRALGELADEIAIRIAGGSSS